MQWTRECDGASRRYVVFHDVSARRALELQQHHDELQRTHRRRCRPRDQQPDRLRALQPGHVEEYLDALTSLVECYAEALQHDDPGSRRDAVKAMRERLDIDFILGDVPQLLSESRQGIERVA